MKIFNVIRSHIQLQLSSDPLFLMINLFIPGDHHDHDCGHGRDSEFSCNSSTSQNMLMFHLE